ncbi:hypothetical protein E2C01_059388 [Portunus trituberculatus]|uniref:Uncharacterized protein n=1 Tax=Portunus trituberculatus TaxID=210409 RepID=A0A5B7H6L4_PORTR|nr:hypothetical protein [Portunus trituberculatus]
MEPTCDHEVLSVSCPQQPSARQDKRFPCCSIAFTNKTFPSQLMNGRTDPLLSCSPSSAPCLSPLPAR